MICRIFATDVFESLLFIVEFVPHLITIGIGLSIVAHYTLSKDVSRIVKLVPLLFVPCVLGIMIGSTFLCSWEDAYRRGYDLSLPSMRTQIESYVTTGKAVEVNTLNDILESNKYHPTFGSVEMRYLVQDLLKHTLLHTDSHNDENIDEGYNKGNDWFHATLGDTMMYTSGIYPTGTETLEEAQNYKIDYIANAIELQPNDTVLDIGCGWTYLAKRFTDVYKAKVTGITLSQEQLDWSKKLHDSSGGAKIFLQDAMKIIEDRSQDLEFNIPSQGYDKITSLEMAEHVGIKRYNEFLTIVHSLLKDDGVFYFQVAGLRRSWRYEDLVWGLFMGEWVFPGADSSCPLGWVSTQLERAGFEIQLVQNLGTHYSRTIAHWLENWKSNEDYITSKYGAVAYRRWEVFLAWSVRIARQGSSTLFSFTLTKAGQESRRIQTQAHLAPGSEGQCNFSSLSSSSSSSQPTTTTTTTTTTTQADADTPDSSSTEGM